MLTPKKQQYPNDIDPEVIDLCNAINCIPGIRTSSSCGGHGKNPIHIFIDMDGPENRIGLFFLARCASRRYWKYGLDWRLEIDVADLKHPDGPPVYVMMCSKSVGTDAYKEAASLVENIIHHLNHKNFIKGYDIDLSRFDLEGEELGDDWWEQIKRK